MSGEPGPDPVWLRTNGADRSGSASDFGQQPPPDLGPILAALQIDRNDRMRYSCTWIAPPKQQTSTRPDTHPCIPEQ